MESSFPASRHEHTCAGCLHWAKTPHADAFLRSRWAHQIRILVFTLDFSLPKCVHLCLSVTPSAGIKAEGILFSENFRSFSYITVRLTPQSDCCVVSGGHVHPTSIFLLLKLTPPRSSAQQAKGLPPLRQSKFTRKWNPLYANKQCGRNKTFRGAVRSFQESIRGFSSVSQPLPGNYPAYFMPPSMPVYTQTVFTYEAETHTL